MGVKFLGKTPDRIIVQQMSLLPRMWPAPSAQRCGTEARHAVAPVVPEAYTAKAVRDDVQRI